MFGKSYDQLRVEALHFWPLGLELKSKYRAKDLVEVRPTRSIASDSLDHTEPRGTARDNTHWLPFVVKCESFFGHRDLRYLDLGCAGGGLVFDFLARRHFAIGLEGSDYSLIRKRAEWATIPDHLFTCDITYPFEIIETANGSPFLFDVIGMWDVMEHLAYQRLTVFLNNVRMHLSPQGFFCGTVSTREAKASVSQRNHHAIVQPKSWWERVFAEAGFQSAQTQYEFALEDFPRGNGILFPADFRDNPQSGFHFVLRRI